MLCFEQDNLQTDEDREINHHGTLIKVEEQEQKEKETEGGMSQIRLSDNATTNQLIEEVYSTNEQVQVRWLATCKLTINNKIAVNNKRAVLHQTSNKLCS